MNKTILVVLNHEVSAFNAVSSLCRDLVGRGYKVVIATIPPFGEFVRALGFDCSIIKAKRVPIHSAAYKDKRQWPSLRRKRLRNTVAEMKAISEMIMDQQASIVLIDQICWWNAIPVLKKGLPFVAVSTCLAASYDPIVPPVFFDRVPAGVRLSGDKVGTVGVLGNLVSWSRLALFRKKDGSNFPVRQRLCPTPGGAHDQLCARHVRRLGGQTAWGEYGPRLRAKEIVL